MFSKAATVNHRKQVGKYAESVSGYILKCVEHQHWQDEERQHTGK